MSEFISTNNSTAHVVDYNIGNQVKNLMNKYVGTELTEDTCDQLMEDLRATFGDTVEAQVTIDTDINDIEVIIRDSNNVLMKCSSLTLFKNGKQHD
jgi:hypothetical protein